MSVKTWSCSGCCCFGWKSIGSQFSRIYPSTCEKALTGYGGANKDQVGYMVKMMLSLPVVPVSDAADALALAMTHAQIIRTQRLTNKEVSL